MRKDFVMNPVVVRNVAIGEGIPKICVPIVGKTREEILDAAKKILPIGADVVGWRKGNRNTGLCRIKPEDQCNRIC